MYFKKTLLLYIVCLFFVQCQEDLQKYYPYREVKLKNGNIDYYDLKMVDTSPKNYVYVDNSKINDFYLYMIYNSIDTVMGFDGPQKIFVVDTLKFHITEDYVRDLNTKYIKKHYGTSWDFINNYKYKPYTFIKVYDGEDVQVILKKDNKIIESYSVSLNHKKKHNYIINPLSKSKFKLSSVQYNGITQLPKIKKRYYSKSFNQIDWNQIDFFLTEPPEKISYDVTVINGVKLDDCQFGCVKSVISQIK